MRTASQQRRLDDVTIPCAEHRNNSVLKNPKTPPIPPPDVRRPCAQRVTRRNTQDVISPPQNPPPIPPPDVRRPCAQRVTRRNTQDVISPPQNPPKKKKTRTPPPDVRRPCAQRVTRRNTQDVISPPQKPPQYPPPHLQTCPKEANKAKTQQNTQAPCSDPGNYY